MQVAILPSNTRSLLKIRFECNVSSQRFLRCTTTHYLLLKSDAFESTYFYLTSALIALTYSGLGCDVLNFLKLIDLAYYFTVISVSAPPSTAYGIVAL